MGKLKLKKNGFMVSCEIPFCTNRAHWTVMGNGPLNMGFNLCEECSEDLYEEFKKEYEPKVEEIIEKVELKKPKKPKKGEVK